MTKTKKKCPKHTVREIRSRWAEALKNTRLDELVQVRRFSSGGSSKVSLVQLKDHPTSAFALKSIRKESIEYQDRENVLSEKNLMNEVDSEFVVKLFKTFKDTRRLYFLTEYCCGGELYKRRYLLESQAKFYIACVVEALGCLHARNIAFNDLKPDNLVMDREGYVRLIDFGLAKKHEEGELAYDFGGHNEYLPPEVILPLVDDESKHAGRDRAVDLWALGCLLCYLVKGETPFHAIGGGRAQTNANVLKGIDSAELPDFLFSMQALDLIRKLCNNEPKKRLGYVDIEEIRGHAWFEGFDWVGLRERTLKPPFVPQVDGILDTQNFDEEGETSASDAEEDNSDWDLDF